MIIALKSYVEVAAILGTTSAYVRQTELRAIKKLSILFLDEIAELNPALALKVIDGLPKTFRGRPARDIGDMNHAQRKSREYYERWKSRRSGFRRGVVQG